MDRDSLDIMKRLARGLGLEQHAKMLSADEERTNRPEIQGTEYMAGYHYGMMTAYYNMAREIEKEIIQSQTDRIYGKK